MGKSTYWSNGILNVLFNGTALANVVQNASSSPLTTLYVSLHTSNPGSAGNQTTGEAAYSGYARVAVTRSTSGWTVSTAGTTSPVSVLTFPEATGGSETETYFGVGSASTGAGNLFYSGPISPSIPITAGVVPQLSTATTIQET